MLFFEKDFFLLFSIFFVTYWAVSPRLRPLLIVGASYAFYAAWDWRFLSLLILSTGIDFLCGQKIAATEEKSTRKKWLALSLGFNLGMLGFFKYFDFFVDSFADLFGIAPENRFLINVILPAGISFYTFQTLSYTVDVYRRKQEPETDLMSFAAFVSFFPQLIAGPIERASGLLTQINTAARFDLNNIYLGARLFLIGLVKKLVIADNMAKFVDPVFADPSAHDPLTLLLAAYCFAFQIYCDFSGYTDMARGLAKSIGIELSINFNFPYLATGIRDFWRRWHITLYSWLRDYVYFPLGGSQNGAVRTYVNIMIVFLLSGLWHGAGWNFILWGGMHGLFICVERLASKTIVGRVFSQIPALVRMFIVFHLVTAAWIVFRAQDMAHLRAYVERLSELSLTDFIPGSMTVEMTYADYWLPTLGGEAQPAFYVIVIGLLCLPLIIGQFYRKSLQREVAEAT